ncbi:MAG TPA: SRPBCC family protein [Thermoanaerobaculia bacterium]|nr:SRPBCC family protein [Thermoanaerobaculia bacterium]
MSATRPGGGAELRRPALPAGLVALVVVAWSALSPSCSPAAASQQPGTAAGVSPVAVAFADLGDSTMRLEGRFTAAAPCATAWSVLTDYDHIPAFVASMRSSRVKERGDGFLLVEQESVAKVLWLRRTVAVLLRVREEPDRSVAFEDVAKTSFERYEGSWTLQEAPGGVEVIYRLTVKARLVGFLTRGPSQSMVRELLEQVRAEVNRRAPVLRPGCEGCRARAGCRGLR